jgi:hypothetical protein
LPLLIQEICLEGMGGGSSNPLNSPMIKTKIQYTYQQTPPSYMILRHFNVGHIFAIYYVNI